MLSVITPSPDLPVTLEEARAFLLQDADITEQDFVIQSLISAATLQVEAATGRSILNATYREAFTRFDKMRTLQYSTVQSITSVKYYDASGVQQTLSANVYELADRDPSYVRLQKGQAWPVVDGRNDGIWVDYVAGYGATGSSVPGSVKLAVLVLVGWMFENRQGQEYPRDTLRALCSSFAVAHGEASPYAV